MKNPLPFLLIPSVLSAVADDAGSKVCSAENSDESCSAGANQAATKQIHNEPQTQKPFKCNDLDENCDAWSKLSFGDGTSNSCQVNSAYMSQHCPITCDTCSQSHLGWRLSKMVEGGLSAIPFCQDNNFNCKQFAEQGECKNNPKYMIEYCPASCGVCSEESNNFGVRQRMHKEDQVKEKMIKDQLKKSIEYMYKVKRDRKYKYVRYNCLNKDQDCTLWAAQGECDKNERFMKSTCAPACMSCEYLGDTSDDCPGLPQSSGPLWKKPGDLNTFFENIVGGSDEYYNQFKSSVLSRPLQKSDGSIAPGIENDGPWLVLLENFVTDEEADRLVQIANEQGLQRSMKAVHVGEQSVIEGRTSSNTWCQDTCMTDPMVAKVLQRIANTTKSTINHSEHLQLLRYEEGQFYAGHSDFIPYQLDLPCGARVMTIFLYLNDVEEGGGTRFPELDITQNPKKGSALLWPNVKNEDPLENDNRTFHEALPVIKGVKYGANSWIHSEDFQTPWKMKCLG